MVRIIKKIMALTCFMLMASMLSAQEFSSEFWHSGELDLESGVTMKGKIKYDLQGESLQFVTTGNVVKSYGAESIAAFEIMDALTKRIRYFYSLPFKISGNYSKKHFFELMTEGVPYTLMVREKIVEKIETDFSPYWGSTYNTRRLVLEHDFFLIDQYAELRQVDLRKSETALLYMKDKMEELEAFIKVNGLNIRDKEDFTQVVNYYNAMKEAEMDQNNVSGR
ncbi:hypothetical protein V6R21_16750 [Limibacter armeniacum]|uniref:hypothetical protein n=1 Tax=Limibacter armeniacum TaxID=466084 RepID=UPI002FE5A7B1